MGTIRNDRKSAPSGAKKMKSIKGKIISRMAVAILLLVLVCSTIMVLSMKTLTNTISLDMLQPMAKEASMAVSGNVHMLADRMMAIAMDTRLVNGDLTGRDKQVEAHLMEVQEIYEFYAIGIYQLDGNLTLGLGNPTENISDGEFFSLLQKTDNLTTADPQVFGEELGIMMGIPVKQNGATAAYLVGIYKYDALNDAISSINVGKNGQVVIINQNGIVVGNHDTQMVRESVNIYDAEKDPSAKKIFDHMITGETGSAQGIIKGKDTFVAFAPVRGTQWSLAIEVPKSDYAYVENRAILVTMAAAIVLILIAMAMVYRLSSSISVALNKATKRIGNLADGDLKAEVEIVNTKDELELLSRSLGSTIISINSYLSEIKMVLSHIAQGNLDVEADGDFRGDFIVVKDSLSYIIDSLNLTMKQINGSVEKLSGLADSLDWQSKELHQASLRQSESMNLLVSEIETVKVNLDNVSSHSDTAKQKASEISGKINNSNIHMSQLQLAMKDISQNAEDISKINKMIEDIASQTNILALNASVEAARAGAAGKGFAVVANEVRSLAGKSSDASKSTAEMLMRSNTMIQSGVSMTDATAKSLGEISDVSDSIAVITEQLVQTVDTQKHSLVEIREMIDDVSTVTSQNLKGAQDTADASSGLSREAESLKQMVNHFTLKEETKS